MAWYNSLLKKPEAIDESTPSAEDLTKKRVGGPPLLTLAPDSGVVSSFRLRFFADATTAAADLEQLTPEMRRGTHAFWALHEEPVLPPEGHSEAFVLIRANPDYSSEIVYAVSFADMESAWSFARFEAKRGLDISQVLILWAAFATVHEGLDGISVLPAAAPTTRAQPVVTLTSRSVVELETAETVREYERPEEPPISDVVAAPEMPEAPEVPEAPGVLVADVAAEARRREEAARRAEAEEAARIARQAEEELREARAAADAARALAEAETARRQEAERLMEEQRQAEAEATAKAEAEAKADAERLAEEERREEAARRAEAEEAARIARQAEEELGEARAAADSALALAEAETARRQEAERVVDEQRQAAETAARARALADMESRIERALSTPEAAAEEPLVLDATSVALEGRAEARAQPLLEDLTPTIEAPAETRSYAGDEETLTDNVLDDEDESAARGTVFAHTQTAETAEHTQTVEIPEHLRSADDSGDPADDAPKVPESDEFDIADEVARLLKNRLWDKRKEPFQGFKSPAGHF